MGARLVHAAALHNQSVCRELRGRVDCGAQWRCILLRSLHVPGLQVGQPREGRTGAAGGVGSTADIRAREVGVTPRLLSAVRGALCLPWRVPEESLQNNTKQTAETQLSVPQ